MSSIIPNTFQSPNAHVDRAMQYLSGDEYKVLAFAVRHIYGWRDSLAERRGHISLSMFTDGYVTKSGVEFGGTGLGRQTVVRVVAALVQYGLLVKHGEPTAQGQMYAIGENPDWDGLEARDDAKRDASRKRIARARAALGGLSDRPAGGLSDRPAGGLSDRPAGGLSDSTQTKPLENQSKPIARKRAGADENKKPRPRNPVWDAVCTHLFDGSQREAARISILAHWIEGKTSGSRNINVGPNTQPGDAADVQAFVAYWRNQHPGIHLPLDIGKFARAWDQWRAQPAPAKTALDKLADSLRAWQAEQDAEAAQHELR
jgi:hypothetical protein